MLSAYVGNSTTELTAGITLSVDFDSRTGLNHVRIVATSGNGYATASDYSVVITTGTVNSVSVVGEVVGDFSIENRQSNVKFWNGTAVATPGTAGIPDINVLNWRNGAVPAVTVTGVPKVDMADILGTAVSAPATAGILDVNVKNMNNVAGTPITTIKAVQGLATDGVIPTATNLTNAPTNGDFTAAMKTSLNAATPASVTGAVGSVTGAVGSVTGNVGGNVVGTVASVVGAVGSVATGGITAASFAANALDAVWSTATRLLTAGTNIVLAKGTGVTGFNDLAQADVRTAVGLASANLDTQLASISSTAIAAAVWAYTVEGTFTALQYMRLFAAAMFGKGNGSSHPYRDTGDTKDRITAVVEGDGDRTSVTLNGS